MAKDNNNPTHKRCTKCREIKPLSEFHKKQSLKSGYRSRCKECRQESTKNYYERNKKAIHARNKKWREKNQDYIRAYRKKRNQTHKHVIRARWEKWYAENQEYQNEYRKNWRQENPDKHKGQQIRRRARELGAEGEYTVEEFNQLCELYNNQCLACGKKIKLEADHIVPLSQGGSNDISNIQPLCRTCNSSKGINIIDYRF